MTEPNKPMPQEPTQEQLRGMRSVTIDWPEAAEMQCLSDDELRDLYYAAYGMAPDDV